MAILQTKKTILYITIPENIMYLKMNKSSTHSSRVFVSGKKSRTLKIKPFFLALKSLPI